MATQPIKIGLLCGRESTFPGAFIQRVNDLGREQNITAELVRLGGTRMDDPNPYRVIVDRISHEIPYYRAYLKQAVLEGVVVINNPFWWSADDKFFECALATKLGVAVPKTVVLPQKDYVAGVVTESLRNLIYPIPWNDLLEYVGLPAYMKPFIGGGWKNVYKVNSVEELIWAFDQTGELGMILQEGITWDQYVRCYCLGQTNIMPIRYEPDNPFHKRYVYDPEFLGTELASRIVHDAQVLNQALGFDMNTVEFAVRDGVPYAIDFLNVAPDMDYHSVGEHYFEWVVENMSRLVIERALNGYAPTVSYRWDAMLNSTPAPAGMADAAAAPSRPSTPVAPLLDPQKIAWAWNPYKIPGRQAGQEAGEPPQAKSETPVVPEGVPEEASGKHPPGV
ncbi:MAG: ATP-grasp domain-containing protein [Chloroflexia bacterium]